MPTDSLPEYHIDDAEQMANVMRTQVDVVLPDGVAVLNAADPRVAALAPLCDGEVHASSAGSAGAAGAGAASAGRRPRGIRRDGRLVLATGHGR